MGLVLRLLADEKSVFAEVADEGMVLLKTELTLGLTAVQKRFDVAQSPGALGRSFGAGLIDRGEGMAIGEVDKSDQGTDGIDAALAGQFPGPLGAGGSQLLSPVEPVAQLDLDRAMAATQSAGVGELTGLQAPVGLDEFEGRVFLLHEDLHLPAVVADPDLPP